MTTHEQKIREQFKALSHEQKENVFINYVKLNNSGAVPETDPVKPCCPAGTCGVCVGDACLKCS